MKTTTPIVILAGAAASLASLAHAQDGAPTAFSLQSVVRDFSPSHPDFKPGMAPGGLVSGNIEYTLGPNNVPAWTGSGFNLGRTAQDDAGNDIAPHMASNGAELVFKLESYPTILNSATMDFWDPELGAYSSASSDGLTDPAIVGELDITEPVVTYASSTGNWNLSGHGVTVVNQNLDVLNWTINVHEQVEIQGDVTIRVRGDFAMKNLAKIRIPDGSSLTMIVYGEFRVGDQCEINLDSWDPDRFLIYSMGTSEVALDNKAQVCGRVYAPDATLVVSNSSNFYGSVEASTLEVINTGGIHVEGNYHESWCGRGPDRLSIPDLAEDGGITSQSTFASWYQDMPGMNAAAVRSVRFADNDGDGVYEYYDDDYTPINGRLYLNDDGANNRYFTTAIECTAVANACNQEFFEVMTDAECWVFINDQLVIDLGSASAGKKQRIDIDRLELNDGEEYTLRFFYAQRDGGPSRLGIRTNIMPTGGAASIPAPSPYYD